MSHLLYNVFITLIISLFPYIASTTEDINNYYSNKTLDEIMLVIRGFETYLMWVRPSFTRDIHIFYKTRFQLMGYINNLIIIQDPRMENLDYFLNNIELFPSDLSPYKILTTTYEGTERGFLSRWAVNAEKYKRKQLNQSDLIGGVIDYANYMPLEQLREYINNMVNEYPELNDRKVFNIEILKYGVILPDNALQYIQTKSKEEILSYILTCEFYYENIVHKPLPSYIDFSHDKLYESSMTDLMPMLYARKLDLLCKRYYFDYGEDSIFELSEY